MSKDRTAQLESYRTAAEIFAVALKQLPTEMLDYKPSPERWSVREIVVHMAESEANAFVRFRKLMAEPDVQFMGYEQDIWANTFRYQTRSLTDHLELFRLMRRLTAELIAAQPESVYVRTAIHPEHGEITFEWYLNHMVEHTSKHIRQMQRNLEAWEAQKVER